MYLTTSMPVLDVWQYGDPSSRRRTIIVGFLKELGPDEEVDEKYWRYDEPERVEWREPHQLKLDE